MITYVNNIISFTKVNNIRTPIIDIGYHCKGLTPKKIMALRTDTYHPIPKYLTSTGCLPFGTGLTDCLPCHLKQGIT